MTQISDKAGSDVLKPEAAGAEATEPTGHVLSLSGPFEKAVGWAIILMGLLGFLTALALARVFVVPVIMAFLAALVFSPLCRWFRRHGVPEYVSATLIVFSVVAGLAAMTYTVALPAASWFEDAPSIAREAERKLRVLAGYAEAMNEAERQIEQAAGSGNESADAPVEVVIAEDGPLTTVALNAPLIAAQTVFVLILMFFILASGSLFYERLVRVMPTLTEKKKALSIAYDIEQEVSRYLLAITTINACLGVCVGMAMWFLGMPNPLAFGLVAFALNFVPLLGAIGGVALSFGVALVALPTAFDAFIVAAAYFVLTSVEGQLITPWLVGRHLRLNTVVILIAVAFWAWLWSVMGMIMAVPLLVCVRVFCKHVAPLRPFGEFLAGRDE